jgi:hypothetical protein
MPGQGEAKWCGVVKGEEEVRIGVWKNVVCQWGLDMVLSKAEVMFWAWNYVLRDFPSLLVGVCYPNSQTIFCVKAAGKAFLLINSREVRDLK